jgi:hypothetical protein
LGNIPVGGGWRFLSTAVQGGKRPAVVRTSKGRVEQRYRPSSNPKLRRAGVRRTAAPW